MAGMHNMLLGIGGSIGSGGTISTINMVDPFGDGSGITLYRLNGDVTDLSGTHNGVANNITYATGVFGQAAVFNSSYFTAYNFLTGQTNFSISYWIYRNASTDQTLFSTTNLASTGSFLASDTNVQMWDGSAKIVWCSPPLNKWTHVVINYSKTSGFLNTYKDGVLCSQIAVSTTNGITQSSDGIIGKRYQAGYNFNGEIDQFRIFNRVLTAAEVAVLYTETKVA